MDGVPPDSIVDNHNVTTACCHLRCLSVDQGARMCEQFTNWVMAQSDLSCVFGAVMTDSATGGPGTPLARSKTTTTSPFTSVFAPEHLLSRTYPASRSRSLNRSEMSEGFTVLGLQPSEDDALIDDLTLL